MNPSAAPSSTRKPRWLPRGLALLTLIIGGIGAYFWYQHDRSERELREAIAETDRLDPGWRLADLEAARPDIPDAENSAPLINKVGAAAIKALNTGKVRENLIAITDELKDLPPNARLDARQTAALRASLTPLAAQRKDAQQFAELPRGRHPFNTSPGVSEPLGHVDHANIVIWLLTEEARLRLQEGDATAAWRSCRAIHNISRSLAGEPIPVTQAIRVSQRQRGLRLAERVLAHGVVADKDLAALQNLLDEDMSESPLLLAVRSHRAAMHHTYNELASGRTSLAEFEQVSVLNFATPTWRQEIQAVFGRGKIKPAHIWTLRHCNEAVEIAKRPAAEVEEAFAKLVADADPPPLARPMEFKNFGQFLMPRRIQAEIDCARVALAVERYRLEHTRWPATLADVAAERFLKEVPVDPYDGQSLRYRATKDGVVVYSIGPDGKGDGDALQRRPLDDQRLEFRLWGAQRRRR